MNNIASLQKENLEFKKENLVLKAQLQEWKHKYEAMLEQFKLAQQRQFAASSEKNLVQPDFFDEAGNHEKEIEEVSEPQSIDVPAHKRVKPSRKPLPEDLPREDHIIDISDSEKECNCGAQKERFGEEITEQLEVIQPKVFVTRHIRPKYACKKCESGVSMASLPLLLLPKSMASSSLIAFTLISKYCDHLPLYRQTGIWKRYGVDIPRNTMCGCLLSVAELCKPLWEQLGQHIVTNDYSQADETTVQVMKEAERNNTQKSYAWVYRGGTEKKKAVIYDYQETRSGQHARDFLEGFTGYLQTDGFKGYDWVNESKDIVHLGCMAHARRPFAELVKMLKKPGKAHQALAYIQKLYKVEKEARDKNLSPEERKALRDKASKPILDALKEWLEKTMRGSPPQGKLGKGIKYMMDRWDELTNYLKDGRLEIDNNGVENSIRPFAIGRKNWLFMGSPNGARAGMIFYSLIMTCKENGIEPSAYFNTMLPRLRACKTDADYQALLPFNIPKLEPG